MLTRVTDKSLMDLKTSKYSTKVTPTILKESTDSSFSLINRSTYSSQNKNINYHHLELTFNV